MKQIPQVKSLNYGLESIQVLRPKILESFPNNLKKKKKNRLKVLKQPLRDGNLNHVLAVFGRLTEHRLLVENKMRMSQS